MVDATWYEIAITSLMIMVLAWVLSQVGLLEQGINLFAFMAMGLVGFLTMRAIQGRKFDWR